jgi:hypothetical protein
MSEVQRFRKALVWALPLYAGTTVVSGWVIVDYLLPTLVSLVHLAPVIRIGVAALLLPFLGAITFVAGVIFVLKAIPIGQALVRKLVKILNFLALASAGVLVLVLPAAMFSQHHFMPTLGYSQCELLKDSPNLWFTDWIKNPDWCVKGKSREWVNEQAARQASPVQLSP